MMRQPRQPLLALLCLLLVAHRTSAQLATVSSTGSHSFSSSPAASLSSSASAASLSSGRSAASEPSLSLPVWALAVLTVGGLAVFLLTLKLASCFYWLTEKQRAERDEEGLANGRSGGVAPIIVLTTTSSAHTLPGIAATATVTRPEQTRKAVPTHISITEQGGRLDDSDDACELSQWDSRTSDELFTEAATANQQETQRDEGVQQC